MPFVKSKDIRETQSLSSLVKHEIDKFLVGYYLTGTLVLKRPARRHTKVKAKVPSYFVLKNFTTSYP